MSIYEWLIDHKKARKQNSQWLFTRDRNQQKKPCYFGFSCLLLLIHQSLSSKTHSLSLSLFLSLITQLTHSLSQQFFPSLSRIFSLHFSLSPKHKLRERQTQREREKGIFEQNGAATVRGNLRKILPTFSVSHSLVAIVIALLHLSFFGFRFWLCFFFRWNLSFIW